MLRLIYVVSLGVKKRDKSPKTLIEVKHFVYALSHEFRDKEEEKECVSFWDFVRLF